MRQWYHNNNATAGSSGSSGILRFDELSPTSSIGALPPGVMSTFAVDSVWQCDRPAPTPTDEVIRRLSALNKSSPLTKLRTNARLQKRFLPIASHSMSLGKAAKFSRISGADAVLLHLTVEQTQPICTGETGFASGVSALSIVSALHSGATHIAIDPFQGAFGFAGVRGVAAFRARLGSRAPAFIHLNETAAFGLAWLAKRRTCFDMFLMDDGHSSRLQPGPLRI
jgi:hypothetical protein